MIIKKTMNVLTFMEVLFTAAAVVDRGGNEDGGEIANLFHRGKGGN